MQPPAHCAARARRWALSEVEAAVLDRAAVGRLIQARPEIGAKLLVKLTQLPAQRLRNTSQQLVRCCIGSSADRFAVS